MTDHYTIDYGGYIAYHRHLGTLEVADNGERHDAAQTLRVGLGYHRDVPTKVLALAWIESNGDPTLVAVAEVPLYSKTWDELEWEILLDYDGDPVPLEAWQADALRALGAPPEDLEPGLEAQKTLVA